MSRFYKCLVDYGSSNIINMFNSCYQNSVSSVIVLYFNVILLRLNELF